VDNQQVIYILDSDKQAAQNVRQLLASTYPHIELCDAPATFYSRYQSDRSGCLIAELKLAGGSGIEVLRELKQRAWPVPAIVLTAHADVPSTVEAMRLGAANVIEKPFRDVELWDAIHSGLDYARNFRAAHDRRQELQRRIQSLSPQEQQIMQLIVEGLPNKVIASRMDVSLRTVESRRKSIYQALGTDNVAEFVGLVHKAATPVCTCTLPKPGR